MNEGTHTHTHHSVNLLNFVLSLEQSVVIYALLKFSRDAASTSSVQSCVSVGEYRQRGMFKRFKWLHATWCIKILPLHWAVKAITTFPFLSEWQTHSLAGRNKCLTLLNWKLLPFLLFWPHSHSPFISASVVSERLKGKCGQLLPFDLF